MPHPSILPISTSCRPRACPTISISKAPPSMTGSPETPGQDARWGPAHVSPPRAGAWVPHARTKPRAGVRAEKPAGCPSLPQPPCAPFWASCPQQIRDPRAQPKGLPTHTHRAADDAPAPRGSQGALPPPSPASGPSGSTDGSPASVPAAALGSGFGVPGGGCGHREHGSPGGSPRPEPLSGAGGTLTDTAPSVLLQLELGAALAAVPGHRELDTLLLAAPVPHGTGVYGWGHRQERGTRLRRMTQPRGLPASGSDHLPRVPSWTLRAPLLCLCPGNRTPRADTSYSVHGPGSAARPHTGSPDHDLLPDPCAQPA